jgi:hypothetical protein
MKSTSADPLGPDNPAVYPNSNGQAQADNGPDVNVNSPQNIDVTQPPDISINVNRDRQAANPYEFTDQEIVDRFTAMMNDEDRSAFAAMWLIMTPDEQRDLLQSIRNPQ